jgi:hypothetical protein
MSVEIRKVAKYPPFICPYARAINLSAGENKVFSYSGLDKKPPLIVSLVSASFSPLSGASFYITVDEIREEHRVYDLGNVAGLDYNEEFKIGATKLLEGYINALSPVTSYALRHTIRVDKNTPLLRALLGMSVTDEEKAMLAKYEPDIYINPLRPYDPQEGLFKLYTFTQTLTSSGTIFRYNVKEGQKAVLLDLVVSRPSSANTAIISLERDMEGVSVFDLDPYCLPGLSYSNQPMRIVGLERLELSATISSGTLKVKGVIGVGKITVPEKLSWGLELKEEEKRIAEKYGLYDMVGVSL